MIVGQIPHTTITARHRGELGEVLVNTSEVVGREQIQVRDDVGIVLLNEVEHLGKLHVFLVGLVGQVNAVKSRAVLILLNDGDNLLVLHFEEAVTALGVAGRVSHTQFVAQE